MSKSPKNAKAVAAKSPTAAKAVAKRVTATKRAPGNSVAVQQKAADKLATNAKRAGRAEAIAKTMPLQSGGTGVAVITTRDRTVVISRMDATTTKLARVGQPVAPLEEYLKTQPKPQARLANGVDAKSAPQSAKAVADQRKAAPATGKGKARTAKADKAKAPSRGTERAYVRGDKKNEAKPDSWRGYMLGTIMAHKDTASAKAAHAKGKKFADRKLDFNWANAQGYIKFAK